LENFTYLDFRYEQLVLVKITNIILFVYNALLQSIVIYNNPIALPPQIPMQMIQNIIHVQLNGIYLIEKYVSTCHLCVLYYVLVEFQEQTNHHICNSLGKFTNFMIWDESITTTWQVTASMRIPTELKPKQKYLVQDWCIIIWLWDLKGILSST